jgi:sec-independent protein translocase protein TatB
LFDIGWSEMAIIMVAALIIIGPKDLPRVARSVGQWVRKGRMLAREFQSSLEDMAKEAELDDVKKEIEKVGKTDLKKAVESSIDPKGDLKSAFDTSNGGSGEETVGKVLNGQAAAKTKADEAVKAAEALAPSPATPKTTSGAAKPDAKSARKPAAKKPATAKKPAARTTRKTASAKSGTAADKPAPKKAPSRKRAAKPAGSSTSGSDASSSDKTGGSSAMAAKSS